MQAASLHAADEPVHRPRILVIDDESNVIDGLSRALGDEFEVDGATDGQSALAALAHQRYPVALIDLNMPGMHGLLLLERMRQAAPHTVRVVHTGDYNLEQALATINRGEVFRFVTKPCSTEALCAVLRDAVEQHRLLTENQALTEARLKTLTSQLVRAERLATLGTMAAAIGHELGNLAAAFKGLYEDLSERLAAGEVMTQDDMDLLAMVGDHIQNHARHMRHLGLPTSESDTVVDAAELCGSTVHLLSQMGVLHGVRLSVSLPHDAAPVRIDRTRLEQIVLNLIKNAIEAVSELDGERRVQVEVTRDADGWVIASVHDNGVGIAPEHLSVVFEPYFTTKGESGTGLGLPMVKQLVEARGGEVHCHSEPGRGTTFEIRLPLAAGATP